MCFILRDTHSFEAVIAAGDAQTSPRNPGPRAALRACCWSHCGQDVMGKVLHQRFCLLRLHLQIQNRKCHPFTCLLVLCGLGSDSLQCYHFTFCGCLVSNFTASCGFQGWVSAGLWCGIQQPVLVSVSGDVLCTSSCHSVCSDIWGSGSVHWASCKVWRGGQEAALQRLHLVSVWRRGHPAAECSW